MDYEEAKEKVNRLRREIFETYVESLKSAIREKGKKTSMFCETLYIDVSECEIEYGYGSSATLDEVYYIPHKDELGFIVWDNEMHTKTYALREFRQGDINMLSTLFYYLVEC